MWHGWWRWRHGQRQRDGQRDRRRRGSVRRAGGGVAAALAAGDATGGVLLEGGDEPVQANHINLTLSEVAQHAWFHFLETYWETGTPEIVDPYEELGLPHADADDD